MGLYECASANSVMRGYDYYLEKGNHVLSCTEVEQNVYEGKVKGSAPAPYHVVIDLKHPRRSTCSCPLANGRRVICKHMMALYFTVKPSEADRLQKELNDYEKNESLRVREDYKRLAEYVNSLSKEQLRRELLAALDELKELRRSRW